MPGFAEGRLWVQDAAAALPAMLLAPRPGERIADLCAAPGGKTAQLAAAGAHVTAVERDAARLARLAENLARWRLPAELVHADVLSWTPPAPFDAVLLDAPCSATGTIRRHPDVPHLKRPRDIALSCEAQDRLLQAAGRMLRPGGRLIYAVCSLQPEEGAPRLASCRPASRPVSAGGIARTAGSDHAGGLFAHPPGDVAGPGRDGRILRREADTGLTRAADNRRRMRTLKIARRSGARRQPSTPEHASNLSVIAVLAN